MASIKLKEFTATYSDDQETKDKVFNRVLEYFIKHEQFWGESIMQCDDPIIDAPNVLAEIADDILKFEIEYNEPQ